MTNIPPHCENSISAIHRLAVNCEGETLKRGVLNHISALVAHHTVNRDACMKALQENRERGCKCKECTEEYESNLVALSIWSGDLNRLITVGDLICQICTHYDSPDVEDLNAYFVDMSAEASKRSKKEED